MTQPTQKDLVCIGIFAGAHGVRGRVRVKSFTQAPADLFNFETVYSEDGSREYHFLNASSNGKGIFISQVQGVDTREVAESLKSRKIYARKDAFPELDGDEFYYADLIGLDLKLGDSEVLGKIKSVQNYGAGDILEVKMVETSEVVVLPFSTEMIPEVNIKEGYLRADKDLVEQFLAEEETANE